jgi:hypothetical protein
MTIPVPFAVRAAYQTKHFNAGIPANPDSVFDALDDPPTTGVDAEQASLEQAQDVGVIQPDSKALEAQTHHRDWLRDANDSASILRPEPE